MSDRWLFRALPVAFLLGCAHPGTQVQHSSSFNFSRYQHIGVTAFIDKRGEGHRIAEGIDSGLRRIGRGGADMKAIEEILKKNKPDPDFGLSVEVLETLHNKASADAVIFGNMAPDWRSASLTLIDAESGEEVLRAVLKPGGKNKKQKKDAPFADADSVVRETLRVFDTLVQ